MKKIRFFSLVLITCLLSVNALVAQYNIGTSNTLTGTIFNNDACSIIGDLCAPIGICDVRDSFNLMAGHLDKFIDTLNGDQSFGIEFVYFTGTTPPADPYIGGTSLGTVSFANLVGIAPNQSAGITVSGNTLALGDYLIYAILSPAHNDPTCRPAQSVSFRVGDPPLSISNGSGTNAVLCSNGAASLSADGFIGNAVKFAGTRAVPNFVEIPDDNSLDFITEASIEMWINPANYKGAIIGKPRDARRIGTTFFFRGGTTLRALFHNGTQEFVDIPNIQSVIPLNTWSHIAVVLSGTSLTFYVNGIQAATKPLATAPFTLLNSPAALQIGNRGPGSNSYYTGSIDEVRLWNTPRTQAEIQANMNHEIAPQTGLVAYYPFNEGGGSCAIDASGTGNMGTFSFDPPMREIPSTAPVDFFSTYSWLPGGQTTKTITATTNGTYTLTATAANGCTATATAQVNVNLPIPTANAGIDQMVCAGQSVTLNATGGSTYAWTPTTGLSNPNIANPIASPTDTTVYTVTVTGANGCSAVDSVQINPIPTADAGMDVAICAGDNTTLFAKGSGTYAWSPTTGLSDPTIANPVASPTTTTIYTLTVTANGCTATDMVEVTVNPAPAANTPDIIICSGESKQLNATGGVSYAWSPATGLSSTTLGTPIASPTVTTDYMVTITNSSGCSIIDTVKVTIAPTPVTNAGSDVILCAGQTAPLMATGSSSAAYTWTPALGLDQANIPNPTANPSNTTDYIVTVMNANGCVGKDTVQVTVNSAGPPVADAGPDVPVCTGLSVNLSGSGNGTYTWTPTATLNNPMIANPIATPTDTTEYILTVTDVTGCKDSDTVIVSPMPTADAGSLSVINICEGQTVALNGQGVGTYTWSPAIGLSATNIANPIASPTTTTTYTLSVLSNGCTATDTIRINVKTSPIIDAGLDVTACFGDSVQLNATGSGINAYAWTPSVGLSATNIANPKAAPGTAVTYKVTGTNSNGCAAIDSVKVILQLPVIVADAGSDTIICQGDAVQLNATGGVTYAWSPATGLSATNIANPIATPADTTTYTVTVTDANGCSRTDDIVVFVTPIPAANAGLDVSICNGASTLLSATGGSAYSWSPVTGLSNPTIANPVASPTSTTNYTVTVSTAGCISTTTDAVTVTVSGGIAPMANAGTDVSICSGDITQLAAIGGVSYSWNPATGLSATNIANPMANPTDTTLYTVEVTDANGCKDIDQVQVNILPLPVAVGGPDISICGGMGQAFLSLGQTGNTYSWSPTAGLSDPNIAMPFASPQDSTVYVLTVTDNAGCMNTDTVRVNAQLIYVDLNAAGANDGSSWADAYTDLQDAIEHPCVSNIWLAKGTYLPTTAHNGNTSDPRLKSFHFDSVAVNIYGGFSGSETDVSQRNSAANLTVLSGDFLGNDVITGAGATLSITNNAENAYRVLVTTNLDSTSVFSGFTVSGANSAGAPPFPFTAPSGIATSRFLTNSAGGGMVNIGSSPTIDDCIFTHNLGDGVHGGGMGNYALAAPTISNSIFANNLADNGGGMYNENAAPTIINCAFTGNVASNNGGGINNNTNAAPTIINSTFIDNLADNGGGMHNSSATPVIINSIIWGNTATTADNAINNLTSTPSISFSLIESSGGSSNWNTSVGTDGGNNLDSDPLFADAANGDYSLSNCSPAINQGDGDNSTSINTSTSDLGANPRFYNSTIIDLGAYEYQNAAQSVVANAGSDVTINAGQNTQLMATGGTTYAWSPATGLSVTNIANPVASPTVTTTYTVTVTDANGCMDTDTVIVTVINITPPGAALNFDGTNDYVVIPSAINSAIGNQITVEGWFNLKTTPTSNTAFITEGFLGDQNVEFTIYSDGVNTVAGFYNGTWHTTKNPLPPLNTWVHIAATYDQSHIKLYYDGVLKASLVKTVALPTGTEEWRIGRRWDLADCIDGAADEIRIWSRALRACEIQEGMNCEFNVSETGLEAYYQFNQGQAGQANPSETSLTDATGNGHTGTLTNFALTGTASNWVEIGGVTTGTTCPDIAVACPIPPGAALSFDGTNDYIAIPTHSDFEFADGTVELWMKATYATLTYHPVLVANQQAGANTRWSYHLNKNRAGLIAYDGVAGQTWNYSFNQNEWYHIAFVENGNNTVAYVNGVSIGTLAINSSGVTGVPLHIGSNGVSELFPGSIDEVRIWNRPLRVCEIEEGMSCELSGSETGLKAYYQFNQGLAEQANPSETSLTDATGNGHDGILTNFALTGTASNWVETGGVTTGMACPDIAIACPIIAGAALNFDGADDFVTLPSALSASISNTITIEGWFNLKSSTSTFITEGFMGDQNVQFCIYSNGTNTLAGFYNGAWHTTSGALPPLNTWVHIAATYDQQNIKLYFDGVLQSTTPKTLALPTGTEVWRIGRLWATNGANYVNGSADEVRIWSRALSECEIQEGMNCELGGSETGLEAYYQFNQGVVGENNQNEISLVDATGNGYDGALTNFALTGTTSNFIETGGVTTGTACTNIAQTCGITYAAALDFDGTDDGVEIPYHSDFNFSTGVTYEAWINADSWVPGFATDAVMGNDNNANGRKGVTLRVGNNGNIGFLIGKNDGSWAEALTNTAPLTTGQWHHVAGTFDGTTVKVYVDGALIKSLSSPGSIVPATIPLRIGASFFTGRNFDGKIDEVRIWNRALSLCEIEEGMNCELSGSETGLKAYYQFNQGQADQDNLTETSLVDATGNGHTGTLTNFSLAGTTSNWVATGGVTTGTTCTDISITCPTLAGAALDLDGTDDYIVIPSALNASITNNITVEGWYNLKTTPTNGAAFITEAYAGDENIRFSIATISNIVRAGFLVGGTWHIASTSLPPLNTWVHIAATYDQQNIKLYYDGVLQASTPETLPLPNGTEEWRIGRRWDLADYITGSVDEVRIWSRALSVCELQAGMNCELSGTETGLEAYYQFNQGQADQDNPTETPLVDATGNGHTGTLTNFTLAGTTSNWVATGGVTTGTTCTDISVACPTLAGAALDLDGADDYIVIPSALNASITNNITVEGWYNLKTTPTNGAAFITEAYAGDENIRFSIATISNIVRAGFLVGGTWHIASTSLPPLNTWVHIAATYDQQNIKLYYDGVLQASTPETLPLPNGTEEWRIGRRWDLADYITGSVDEVRIWSRALSVCELQAGMNCELSGTETGLEAYYQFNQGLVGQANASETSLADVTGNGHNGTLINFSLASTTSNWVETGGVITGMACPDITIACPILEAAALGFDGTNDYVTLPANTTINGAFTVEFWHKPTAGGGTFPTVVSSRQGGVNGFIFYAFTDNRAIFSLADNNGTAADIWANAVVPSGVVLDEWQHWAGSFDGVNEIKLYINGNLAGSAILNGSFVYNPNNPLYIGQHADLSSNYNGQVDEVRIWNRALSECEIQEGMNCELSGTETDLKAYYQFNQGLAGQSNESETTLIDKTSNGHNGTLSNFALTSTVSNWVETGGVTTGMACPDIAIACPILAGAALDLDGADDYIVIPSALNASITNNITVEGWYNLKTTPTNGAAFITEAYAGDENIRFSIATISNIVRAGFLVGGTWHIASTSLPPLNTWVHIAATYDQQNIKLYYDGVLQASTPETLPLPNGTEEWRIGRRWDLADYITGSVDEVRIWSRALSACELQAGMNCELSGTETGLEAYYQFNQGLAGQANAGETSLADATGNGHNGTLINFSLAGTTSNWVETGGVTTGTACPNIAAACPSLVEIAPTSKIDHTNQPALISNEAPINFQVSPNPFINQTKLSFDLPKEEIVSIKVFDRTGRLIEEVLSLEKREAGSYQIMLSDENLYNGLFYLLLQTSTERVVKKVIAIKDGRGRNNDDD